MEEFFGTTACLFTDPMESSRAIATANMDGSWWVDWPRMEEVAAMPLEGRQFGYVPIARLLVAARPTLTEVSEERAKEIATEYHGGN